MRSLATKRIAGLGLPFVLLLSFMSGCKSKPIQITPDIASSDEALFKIGEQSIGKDQEKGLLYLRQIIDSFPKSFYAQRAKLLIADTYFKKGDESNLILAASEYRDFIKSYPFSPSTSYCQYRIGLTYYKKMLKPGRDQTKTEQALAEFKKCITDYPASDEAKTAQVKVRECEERLAEHMGGIGIQYVTLQSYRAGLSRLMELVSTYPNYSHMDEIYFYIAEAYFGQAKLDQAVPYYSKLLSDYPKSRLVKKTIKRQKQIEYLKKNPPKPVKVTRKTR